MSKLTVLKKTIDRFHEEIIQLCSVPDETCDTVFQRGVQLFPLSTLPVEEDAEG